MTFVCPELWILYNLKLGRGEEATGKAKCCTGRGMRSMYTLLPYRKPLLPVFNDFLVKHNLMSFLYKIKVVQLFTLRLF